MTRLPHHHPRASYLSKRIILREAKDEAAAEEGVVVEIAVAVARKSLIP